MEYKGKKILENWFIQLLLLCVFLAIASSFYFFFFKKDYNFLVEVPCDATKEVCFQRDCTNPDDCPPNGLTSFKRYNLKASDFKYCENEDCTLACESEQIQCEKIECVEDVEMGESCVALEEEPVVVNE